MTLRLHDWAFGSEAVVVVATSNADGAPEIARSLGARPTEGGRSITVFVPVPEGLSLLNLMAETRRIAVTFGRPRDYKSIQVKGSDAAIVGTTPADEAWVARYRAEIGPSLEPTGIPPALWDRMFSPDFVAVRFSPEGAWDQTPGPDAGRSLEAEG